MPDTQTATLAAVARTTASHESRSRRNEDAPIDPQPPRGEAGDRSQVRLSDSTRIVSRGVQSLAARRSIGGQVALARRLGNIRIPSFRGIGARTPASAIRRRGRRRDGDNENLKERSAVHDPDEPLYFDPENTVKANTLLLALAVSVPLSTLAQHDHGAKTPYAGMQHRAIKSLSDKDLEELRRGGGWGLALTAELNGMPGPAHLLELKDRIPLTKDQVAKTQVLFDDMRKAAIPLGERLIAAETALETAFAKGTVDEASLRRLLAEAESARAELRFVHLSQHFKTVQYLEPEQIKRYSVLRGYTEDPCKTIPAGHNPEMYRRHMGCH